MAAFFNRLAQLLPQSGYVDPDKANFYLGQGLPPTGPNTNLAQLGGRNVDTPDQGVVNPLQQLAQPDTTVPEGSISTPILDRYRAMIGKMPRLEDYQPSTGQKVLGSIAALGAGASPVGIADGQVVGFRFDPKSAAFAKEQTTYEPYHRAMDAYNTEADLLGKGAEIESRDVTNKRLIEQNKAMMDYRYSDLQRKYDAADQRHEAQMNAITQRAETAEKLLQERGRESDGKLESARAGQEIQRARADIAKELGELRLAQQGKESDAKITKMQQDHELALQKRDDELKVQQARIKDLEAAAKKNEAQAATVGQGTQTTETKTTGHSALYNYLMPPSLGGTGKYESTEPAKVVTKKPIAGNANQPPANQGGDPLRAQAIQILTEGKKAVNEQTIATVIQRIKAAQGK